MDNAVWVVSGLLAAFNAMVGIRKLTTPRERYAGNAQMAWTEDFSPRAIKLIGLAEVLGAVGLILPWLTGIAPVLTPLAATGLGALQVGAALTHLRRGERQPLPINTVLVGLAAFVAVVRFTQL